jgi:hypothetical protein
MNMKSHSGMILAGECRRTRRETCPSSTLSTTNPTRTGSGANPGLRGKTPATNSLGHGTALPLKSHIGNISLLRLLGLCVLCYIETGLRMGILSNNSEIRYTRSSRNVIPCSPLKYSMNFMPPPPE